MIIHACLSAFSEINAETENVTVFKYGFGFLQMRDLIVPNAIRKMSFLQNH